MTVVGIDVGKTGGLCAMSLLPAPEQAALVYEPWTDPYRFADFLEHFKPKMVFVEKVSARPGQGVVSMFSFGIRFGEILGVLAAMNQPHQLVPPATWCKAIHAGCKAGKPKERSLEAIQRLFPGYDFRDPDSPRSKKKHPGIVDAVLLAEYGRRQLAAKA